jgi:transposase
MYMNVFCIPRFAGLIPHIYKPTTSSHSEPELLMPRLWPSPPMALDSAFVEVISYQDSWIEFPKSQPKWSSSIPWRFPMFPSPEFSESAIFPEVSAVLKQETDPWSCGHSAIVSPTSRRLANSSKIMKAKPSLGSLLHVYMTPEFRHLQSSEGERFLSKFPTHLIQKIIANV